MREKQTLNVNRNLILLGGLLFMGCLCQASELSTSMSNRNISAMFVMGDSSVDCGDNTLFYSRLHRNLSLLPCNGSRGALLPHLLAEKMVVPHALAFYNQNGSTEDLMNGVNFGSAQATIMNPGSHGYQSLNQQLRQVSETIQLLHLQLSQKMLLHVIRSSVFYLSFGKDDYINHVLTNNNSQTNSGRVGIARILAAEMERAVRRLHDLKIRRIVCMGILPLGCTPRMMATLQSSSNGEAVAGSCMEKINDMVLDYNLLIENKIMKLNADFPDARIVFCDVYQGIRKIIANSHHYGIEEVKSACCGMGLYGAEIGCVSVEMACKNKERHLWWDQYNPTKAVNSLLADSAWSGQPISGLCRPITIQQLASSPAPRIAT